ncbi:MAG: hypothetical protein PHO41_05490 [Eubacteriales bacterium]|nr:hypothetical protein [Eubacteriales bacterium]
MKRSTKRTYRPKRRRTSLNASNAGPILKLLGVVLAVLGAIALVVFVALPKVLPLFGVTYQMPWTPTPTPRPTPRPTPTPHPVSLLDPIENQTEVVLSGNDSYSWFADPYACGDELVFVTGRAVDGNVKMDRLMLMNMVTQDMSVLDAKLENDGYASLVMNEKWLAYIDYKTAGGGVIRAMHRETGAFSVVKEVYVGLPYLCLTEDYLVFMDQTGSRMDKLFACDLNTMETVTVQTFPGSQYGQSQPCAAGGEIVYADEDPNATEASSGGTSAIYRLNIKTGKLDNYTPNTYVHDPKTNGRQWLWRNGLHGDGNDLYWTENSKPATLLAEDIVDYALTDTFAVYSQNEGIYVYFFDDGSRYRITPENERERAQLMGAYEDTVVWMDITSRERDIMKFARVQ